MIGLAVNRSISTSVTSALEVNFNNMRYINLHFTLLYLLTLLYLHHAITTIATASADVLRLITVL